MTIQKFLEKLIKRENLTIKEARELLDLLSSPTTIPVQIAAILTALNSKGESKDEITGFIEGMRNKMQTINASDTIDVCGTGGDKSNTFNISTAVAFVVAGAGVKVAKHGNRSASSKCGSADVLEALKININLSPKQAEEVLKKIGMVFLFAPNYHAAFKQVGSVRKQLGIRTIFNFLGPFVSPARVTKQIVGVPDVQMAKKLAKAAVKLNYKHLAIVVGSDGLDEVSIFAKTTVFEVKGSKIKKYTIDPRQYFFNTNSHSRLDRESIQEDSRLSFDPELASTELSRMSKTEGRGNDIAKLMGGSPEENAVILQNILNGEMGPKRDIVVLNSALALVVAGKAKNIKEGICLAQESLDLGKALKILKDLQKETQKYA